MKYVYIILICSLLSALWVDTTNNVSNMNTTITYDSVSNLAANIQLGDNISSMISEATTIIEVPKLFIKEETKEIPTRLTKTNTKSNIKSKTVIKSNNTVSKSIIKVLNINLRQYIIDHEGLMLQPYECLSSKGKKKRKFYTIGYGHVIKSNESYLYKGITKDKAESILTKDLLISYEELCKLKGVDNLTLNQKLATSHFIFALGIGSFTKSTIYKHICNGDIDKVKEKHFTEWCRINGKKNKNLLKMRKFEYNLWLK